MSYIKTGNSGVDSSDWSQIKAIYLKSKNTGTDSTDWSLVKNGFIKVFNTGTDSLDWQPFYTSSVLTPPSNFVATVVSSSEIDLSWDQEANVQYYDIYRNTSSILPSSPWKSNIPQSTTTYKDTGLSNTNSYFYYYWIRSKNTTQISSVYGPVGNGLLNSPNNFTININSSTNTVTLTWNAVTNATGYYIYRSSSSSYASATLLQTVTGGLTYATDALSSTASGSYYYWIIAFNSLTSSSPTSSNPAYVTAANVTPTGPSITVTFYTTTSTILFQSNSWGPNTSYVIVRASLTKDSSGNPTGTILSGTINTATGYYQMPVVETSSDQIYYWSATPYNSNVSPVLAGTPIYGSVTVTGLPAPTTAPTVTDSTSFSYTSLQVAVGDSNTTDIFLEFGATTNYELFNTSSATEIDLKSPSGLPATTIFGNVAPGHGGTVLANDLSNSKSLTTSASSGTTYYWRATPYNYSVVGPISTGTVTTVPLIYHGSATISGNAVSGTTLTGSTSGWFSYNTVTSYYVVLQSSSDNINWSDISATAKTSSTSPGSSNSYTVTSADGSNQTYFRAKASATSSDGTSAFVYSSSVRASAASVSPSVSTVSTISPTVGTPPSLPACPGTITFPGNYTCAELGLTPLGGSDKYAIQSGWQCCQGYAPTPTPSFSFAPFSFVPTFVFAPSKCIHEDTMISTPKGDIRAKDILPGDYIYSINIEEVPNSGPDGQAQFDYSGFESTTLRSTDGLVETLVVSAIPGMKDNIMYFNGNNNVKFSLEQPMFIKRNGEYEILPSGVVEKGDYLLEINDQGQISEVLVEQIDIIEGSHLVMLFDCEPQDWFIAGGYLVHNK